MPRVQGRDMAYDAAILGGGPAGAAAALWLFELGLRPVLIEQAQELGGLQRSNPYVNTWIPGVRDKTGVELAREMHAHILATGLECRLGETLTHAARTADGGFILELAASAAVESRCLTLATGVRARTGGLTASERILIGPGSVVEDADLAGQRVALLGGGDNAAENYTLLARKGPALIHIYARTLRARPALLANVAPADLFQGPVRLDETTLSIEHQGVRRSYDRWIALYGWEANPPAALADWLKDARDARGFIAVDAERRTRIPGIWAIGEIAQAVHPCVLTAMSDGVIAAKSIEAQLLRERRAPPAVQK